MSNFVLLYLLVLLGCSVSCYYVAESRGRSGFLHAIIAASLGLLTLSPFFLFGLGAPAYLLFVALLPHAKSPCPKCGNLLVHTATICPHCQATLLKP